MIGRTNSTTLTYSFGAVICLNVFRQMAANQGTGEGFLRILDVLILASAVIAFGQCILLTKGKSKATSNWQVPPYFDCWPTPNGVGHMKLHRVSSKVRRFGGRSIRLLQVHLHVAIHRQGQRQNGQWLIGLQAAAPNR